MVDLHVHSNHSDGTYTPTELVDYAIAKNLTAFALTDHDTTDGLAEAVRYAKGKHIEVIPGIEFSTEYEGKDIHILGLYIDYERPEFQEKIQAFVHSRILRNQKMCSNLVQAGIDISYEALTDTYPNAVITRAHYAKYLWDKGYVKSMAEAFDRYVGDHCPYFVPREKVTPVQAVTLILEAGGIPILAHPTLYHFSDARLEKLIQTLKEAGLLGIEAIYSTYTAGEERQMKWLAKKYNLLISGGSDFHGANKPKLDLGTGFGKLAVSDTVLEEIKKSRKLLIFSDLDGTLLNKESKITPYTMEVIDKLSQKGHRLILTSGRPLNSILEVKKAAGLNQPGMLIISNNGALVYDCDTAKPLSEHRLSQETLRGLTALAASLGIYCHAYTDTHIIAASETDELTYYTKRIHLPFHIVADIADALPEGTFKLMVINLTDKRRLEQLKEKVEAEFADTVQAVFSNDRYLELLPVGAGKGNAVRFVCHYFDVPLSQSYGFGDAENDLSMLEAVGTAVAMKNAEESVKAVADVITEEDNDHDGVAKFLLGTG